MTNAKPGLSLSVHLKTLDVLGRSRLVITEGGDFWFRMGECCRVGS